MKESKTELEEGYIPSVCVYGYKGGGKYLTSIKGKHTKVYKTWKGMLERCYSKNTQEKQLVYKDCSVHPDWHNFQNFAEWFEENYVESYHLDKDILFKGNKVYSSETCCFVPKEINYLFTKNNKKRGDEPIGVRKFKEGLFTASIRKEGRGKHLGYFTTPEEAFQAYKVAKEQHIKKLAVEYYSTGKIPLIVYQALYNYQVGIND